MLLIRTTRTQNRVISEPAIAALDPPAPAASPSCPSLPFPIWLTLQWHLQCNLMSHNLVSPTAWHFLPPATPPRRKFHPSFRRSLSPARFFRPPAATRSKTAAIYNSFCQSFRGQDWCFAFTNFKWNSKMRENNKMQKEGLSVGGTDMAVTLER